jgi:hypothetical protein
MPLHGTARDENGGIPLLRGRVFIDFRWTGQTPGSAPTMVRMARRRCASLVGARP